MPTTPGPPPRPATGRSVVGRRLESPAPVFRCGTVPGVQPALLEAIAVAADQDPRLLTEILRDVQGSELDQFAHLAKLGIVDLQACHQAWAESLGLSFHPLDEKRLDPRVLHKLPLDVARRYGAVAVDDSEGMLSVAMRNPFDILAIDAIQEVAGMPVMPVMSTAEAIQRALERMEKGRTGIEGLITRLQKSEVDLASVNDADKLRTVVGDDAVVQLVDYLIEECLRSGASDLHIEPQRDALRVRVRVDGSMEALQQLPTGLGRAVVARLKVMAGMDIGESRKPQDGRFAVSEKIEMRASVLPSVLGEKAVLRVLNRGGVALDPSALCMPPHNLELFRKGYTAPNGIVLLTGPTGSGKTTTLYTAMGELNTPDCNVVTVEDPVEYEMAGTTQVQVDVKANRTFASALRSILRQDPDVVMVGEIRDAETAGIAIQAALTGHMVLSTLHTNDAISSVHRLVDMGVAPYLLGPALRCVVGQRLVPRICADCAEPTAAPPELLEAFGLEESPPGLRKGAGCKSCRGRGKRGRMGIHEVMYVSSDMARLISRGGGSDHDLEKAAVAAGYRRMLQDGLLKATQGLVGLDDVLAIARSE